MINQERRLLLTVSTLFSLAGSEGEVPVVVFRFSAPFMFGFLHHQGIRWPLGVIFVD